ncbi:glycosyltransferase family 2 protein [Aquabacterium soli]|uniref:Glycosyltransferase family 2 protein n=1 Tax=Aquabacterium soli TaxID=2493092 RepID=A0A3R8RZF1_9BURK|nr:glycosyltransferase family 2 protein [Aquabacterium soli]RRR99938.1 glycosyltransferase family 2 protein [Aquabacterium soli]
MSSRPVISIMMACFNRRQKTLECLRRLQLLENEPNYVVDIWILDDGSTDGTAEAIEKAYPTVNVIRHAGGLYWNRAMHMLFSHVRDLGRTSYYVWLNDDTMLHSSALRQLLSVAENNGGPIQQIIVVGATMDSETKTVTYSAHRRISSWKTLKTAIVAPSLDVQKCDTFNGNFVLISNGAVSAIGVLDPFFEHGMGDLDYGLRARKARVLILLAPGFVGTCSRNSTRGTFEDESLSLHGRWLAIKSPKGLPFKSWFRFTFRHGGIMAPILFAWPYLRTVASALKNKRIFAK